MNNFVQLSPDQTGKFVQTFENVISTNTVEACPVVAIDPTGYGNSSVQINAGGTGKKIQYFQNTVGETMVNALGGVFIGNSGV